MFYGPIRFRASLVLSMLIWSSAHRSDATGEPSSVAAEVTQILEIGWKASPEDYSAAQEHYGQAIKIAPGDVRAAYAMALVAVRNHHRADSMKYLDAALSSGKPLLPIRRTKIWLEVMQKNKDATKTDLRELAHQLSLGDSNRADFQETARWLGTVLGYYEGPGNSQLPAADVAALEGEISNMLPVSLADSFKDGKGQAAKQYARLQEQLVDAHRQAKARNENKSEEDRKKIDSALARASEKTLLAGQQLAEFQKKFEGEVQTKQRGLDSDESDIRQLDREKQQLDDQLKNEKAKNSAQQNPTLIAQLNLQYGVAEGKQRRLIREARELSARLSALSAQNDSLSREVTKQKNLEEGLRRRSEALDKPATDSDAGTKVLEDNLNWITTYAPIELELEKQRILDTYKKVER